ncbi:DNA-binding protein [Nocardiopsis sp. N85]|uniref:DNA-binding protein n=1 Tax=Nocardiopsis sp. N85 TaxID=3029400 RepID=UPI00237F1A16|nr:DNA-binding protein [Nocardiopsis sp. N85]MDE3722776.1 DNA-binding protein [Nocardiopsis sp. N85]
MTSTGLTPPDPDQARKRRTHQALTRITERHATGEDRARWESHSRPMAPLDALRRVCDLAAGSAIPDEDRPGVDTEDLMAALTLLPLARAEFDQLELGLLQMTKGRDMTWQDIAFGLGLGSAQAARQRHDRLTRRTP